MPAHLPAQRRADAAHLGLDVAVPALPHHRSAAEFGDPVEQRLAGFDVGDDRRAGPLTQQRFGEQRQDLVAPHGSPAPVDRADPVAVAVERDPEVEAFLDHDALQVGEVRLLGRIGMMMREVAVDLGVEQPVLAGQQRREPLDRRPRRAASRIPGDAVRAAGVARKQVPDIGVEHVRLLDRAVAVRPIARRRRFGERANVFAEEGAVAEHEFEAVLVLGIVAPGHLDARIDLQRRLGPIEHRRRPDPDPHYVHARGAQSGDQRRFEHRRREPPVAPDRDAPPATGPHARREAPPDRDRRVLVQSAADDAADVVFAQHARIDDVPQAAAFTLRKAG